MNLCYTIVRMFLLGLVLVIASTATLTAQSTCTYTLNLHDSFGDGWNGASIDLSIDGVSTNYTLPLSPDGEEASYNFQVTAGQIIALSYNSGNFEGEVTYDLLDGENIIIFQDGPYPDTGAVFTTTAACATCASVTGVTLDPRATTAKVSWQTDNLNSAYRIEHGAPGFAVGTGTVTIASGSFGTITGLTPNTPYELYIRRICAPGDTSNVRGPFAFSTVWANDVGIVGLLNPVTACTLSNQETLTVELKNFGGNPQTLIAYRFSVDGVVAPVAQPFDGYYTGVIGKDSIVTLTFMATGDFGTPGPHEVKIWTELENDDDTSNDTLTTIVSYDVSPLPISEDFNNSELPEGWTISNAFGIGGVEHNNTSPVLFVNLYSFNNTWTVTTRNYGFIAANDSLFFDYRITDWSAGTVGTVLSANDKITVQISTDCGETFETLYVVNETNHTTSAAMQTVGISLANYVGEAFVVRFFAEWGQGDYWVDIDNVRMTGCPYSFQSNIQVTAASNGTATDGTATLTPTIGNAPYSYRWSHNVTTSENTLTNLAAGTYQVTITDAGGCEEVIEVIIGNATPTTTIEALTQFVVSPNPTEGQVWVHTQFAAATDATLEVVNALGQVIVSQKLSHARQEQWHIDLATQPTGIYFIRLQANGGIAYRKLIKG